ncbi:hypothetical protein SCG7086_BJ_00090 [Chlamydiales bacterium SCGC AG-110-P3]|nr:hypothetical protein SCG7086_BJ_00090 [Chlamydiales bacterium SCGC AG-110-P3]
MRTTPQYAVFEYTPKKRAYCVCVFVLNEGKRIAAQLRKMKSLSDEVDIIVADGGSSDGVLAEDFLRSSAVRTLLVKQGGGKLGAQMRMAFDYALSQGYKGVITIDGNNKDDPRAIPKFIEALESGYAHLQGSRYIPGGVEKNTPRGRYYAVKLIHAPLIRLSSGFPYTDTTNGFRAYSRELLLDPRIALFREVFEGYELHYYLAIRSAKLGYTIKEIPVSRKYPSKGGTPTKISFFRGNLRVLGCLFSACLHRYDPIALEDKTQ